MTKDGAKRLILVDGSGYIFRAYHALPPLTRKDGTAVGAVYGYCSMLTRLLEQYPDDHFAVIFDAGRVTFRNEIYPDYKANRDAPPEDLIPQFGLIREATNAFNLPCIELEGYEADDLIASYAKSGRAEGYHVTIVSSDKDLMQLMQDEVVLYDPMKQKDMTLADVEKKFGVTPDKVTEVQALMGDSVDNIPGVPGIGPKTAAQLIMEYGDLETLLERANEIKQNKRRENLIAHAEDARMSFKLVTLDEEVALPEPIEGFARKAIDTSVLVPFLREQNFNSMVKKWDARGEDAGVISNGASASEKSHQNRGDSSSAKGLARNDGVKNYTLVQDEAALDAWVKKIEAKGVVAFDTETTGLDATQARLVGISLAVDPFEACYIPINHVKEGGGGAADLFGDSREPELQDAQLSEAMVLKLLKPLLEDSAILKIGQNIKYDLNIMRRYDVAVAPVADTMLMSYACNAGLHAHNMDELAQRYLEETPIAYKEVVGTGKAQKGFAEIELEKAKDYAAEDADITLRLYHTLLPELVAKRVMSVYERIERPLVSVIAQMESEGIKIDPDVLKQMSNQFAQDMAGLETHIHGLSGREFNIGSPKQLGEILFDEMSIEGGKKSSKTGAYSTGAEILEDLAGQGYEIAEKVLEWRQLSKLKSTYTDALQEQVNPETGRVHTSFSMAATTTGRLSSSDPNLQNIPIRTEAGRKIRTAFIAEPGHVLISADYSQIELRLLADMAEIEVLRDAFKHGRDIHATTASQMFGVPIDAVESDLRRKAKTINFGIIYGISAHGLSTRLGIGRKEAADYIETYFEQYPGIRKYMECTKEFAREHGYVETLFGRKVHTKDINAKNPNLRAFSERAAINAPLQGTAADIIKRAMVKCAALTDKEADARMLLQVHDELIFEVQEDKAEAFAEKVKRVMSKAAEPVVQLSVPLDVEAGIGNNWGESH